jgi:hypothetical protein
MLPTSDRQAVASFITISMTTQQAEHIFKEYLELLADQEMRGARRSPSLLPTSKDNLIRAIKLLVAQLYRSAADTQERLEPFIQAAMSVDSFNHSPLGATEFIEAMQDRRKEIWDFRQELSLISRNHRFFWQRVYALVGVVCETRRATLLDTIRQKLGRRGKSTADGEAEETRFYNYSEGRYDLE